MGKRTCSVEGCEKPAVSRGWCGKHYQRWRLTGSPVRPCKTCGGEIEGTGPRFYCSDECKPFCRIEGCGRRICAQMDVCRGHYDTIQRNGGKDPAYTWAKKKVCLVCGATDWPGKGRKACSERCRQLLWRSGGEVAQTADCVRCGHVIDLFERSPRSGRKKRAETMLCRYCKAAKHVRHGVSVTQLYNRDGDACGICGEAIDLTLRHPDLMCPTVDHVIPFALGGAHDITNCQLAHLTCNVTKQARIGWTPAR